MPERNRPTERIDPLCRQPKDLVVGQGDDCEGLVDLVVIDLGSLQMGFRTLALEKRSAEVWEVLGAVKTEFGKFGEVLAKTKKKLDEASNTISDAETRTRAMTRKLKSVETLPESQTQALLGNSANDECPGDLE